MRNIIPVVWSSHLTAAAAAALLFSVVDPAALVPDAAGSAEAVRVNAYTLGFFAFWALALLGGIVTRYLDKPLVGAPQ